MLTPREIRDHPLSAPRIRDSSHAPPAEPVQLLQQRFHSCASSSIGLRKRLPALASMHIIALQDPAPPSEKIFVAVFKLKLSIIFFKLVIKTKSAQLLIRHKLTF